MDPVTVDDLQTTSSTLARISQRWKYQREIDSLNRGYSVGKALFLDDSGLLLVGGRLQHSLLPFSEKHPSILNGRSHLAKLVIGWAHERSLYAGFRSTYARVLQKAWLVRGRSAVRSYVQRCVTCAKSTCCPLRQIMAGLPQARVTPFRAFSRCGVDYAGPFSILSAKGRGVKSTKGYIVLFVCFSTKVVHLELVGDLTTQSFLVALTRFIGNCGAPQELWSDNGTNFRGASNELLRSLRQAELDWGLVKGELAIDGVVWKFIPPSALHFGGLWEAGIKSAKHHLRRIVATNCRPLTPLSGDLEDIEALTPAHFLVGGAFNAAPRPSAAGENLDSRTHWALVQAMRDQFWAKWSREYLHTLKQRAKWTRPRQNLDVGDLVVLLDPSLLKPNGRWPVGRVIDVHLGDDILIRVVSVRTETGTQRRPIVKLASSPGSHRTLFASTLLYSLPCSWDINKLTIAINHLSYYIIRSHCLSLRSFVAELFNMYYL